MPRLLGTLARVAAGALATLALGWKLFNYFRALDETAPPDSDAQTRPYARECPA
jgi:hypothetical protein